MGVELNSQETLQVKPGATDLGGLNRDQRARERFLNRLDDEVRPLSDPAEITATCARLLGEHLDTDRCAYADVEEDQDTFNLTGDYSKPGVPSVVGRYRFADFGQHVLDLMRADQPFVANDVDRYEPSLGDLSAYRATNIQGVICVPLHKAGRFVAAMAVHQRVPRVWVEDEVRLVLQVAARCWESIERSRIERTLRESEQRFRTAFEQAVVGMVIADIKGIVIRANAAFCAIVGRTSAELIGHDSRHYTYAEDRQPNTEQINRLESARRGSAHYEKRYVRPDGQIVWCQIHLAPLHDSETDSVPNLLAFVEDITHRKEAEQELKRLAEQRRLALDSAQLGWWHLDPATGVVTWDDRMRDMYGVTADHMSYTDIIELIHPRDRQRVDEAVSDALDPDTTKPFVIEYRIIRPSDRAQRWIEAHGKADFSTTASDGKPIGFAGTVADVTETRAATEQLEYEKVVLERIASGAPLEEVLDLIVRSAEAQSNSGMLCSIFMVDDSGTHLRLGAAPRLPQAYRGMIDGQKLGDNLSPCAAAAFEKTGVNVVDSELDGLRWDSWRKLAAPHGLASCFAAPIFSADHQRTIGTVAMYYRTTRSPGDRAVALTRMATYLAGSVIERHTADPSCRYHSPNGRSKRPTRRSSPAPPSVVTSCSVT